MNQEHWHEDFELENRRFSQGWNQNTAEAANETLATERVPVAQPEGTATVESTDLVLTVALQNLATARGNLDWRYRPHEDANWLSFTLIEGQEDVAKWERIVERLKHVQ